MKSKDFRKKLLENNSEFRAEYLKRNLALELSHLIVLERVRKGYTQEELARMVGTKQSGIARSERGNSLPKLDLLERIARALGRHLSIEFKESQTETKEMSSSATSKLISIYSYADFANKNSFTDTLINKSNG